MSCIFFCFVFRAEDGIRDYKVTGVQTCALPISRCMEVGAATARVMAKSPWRTAIVASSSWSHSFLTEKHYQLWPDVAADRRLRSEERRVGKERKSCWPRRM